MKILIVTTQDRFFLSHIRDRACYFRDQGYVVAVAAQKTSQKYVDSIKALGFDFFDTRIIRRSINPLSQILAIANLYSTNRKFKPDISFHLGAKAIFWGTIAARLYKRNTAVINAPIGLGYVFASDNWMAKLIRPFVLSLYRFLLNPTNSRVIIENEDDIDFFVAKNCLHPGQAYCILGAGVDTVEFSPLPFSERNSVCTVVMASRLIKEKGVHEFIEVANELYKLKAPVRMQLLGEPDFGNPSSLSAKELEELKQNPAIEYLGFQDNVSSIIRKAHICMLPSYYREGLPRILVEACCSGLAILTTNTVGCRETIRCDTGIAGMPSISGRR